MTAADLSADLARALGYEPDAPGRKGTVYIKQSHGGGFHVRVWTARGKSKPRWRTFSYDDPTVYGPLVAWLLERGAQIRYMRNTKTFALAAPPNGCVMRFFEAATLPEAVARAVIAVRSGR